MEKTPFNYLKSIGRTNGLSLFDDLPELLEGYADYKFGWRKYPDEKPGREDDECTFITKMKNGTYCANDWEGIKEYFYANDSEVTHWMPIPPL